MINARHFIDFLYAVYYLVVAHIKFSAGSYKSIFEGKQISKRCEMFVWASFKALR